MFRLKRQKAYELGKTGEERALAYFKKAKYKIIKKSFRLHRGEIDIIAYDRKTLVFVEVKTRRKETFGLPEEAVTPAKQQKIRRLAEAFLALNGFRDIECRFDVLSLTEQEDGNYLICHIKNAF